MKTWVEISSNRLIANSNSLQQAAGAAIIMAVIKANAYGHSAEIRERAAARDSTEPRGNLFNLAFPRNGVIGNYGVPVREVAPQYKKVLERIGSLVHNRSFVILRHPTAILENRLHLFVT